MQEKWYFKDPMKQKELHEHSARVAWSHGIRRADAEDIAQESQLRVAERTDTDASLDQYDRFTFVTIRNLARSEGRRQRRHRQWLEKAGPRVKGQVDPEPSTLEIEEWLQFLEKLYEACSADGRFAFDLFARRTSVEEYRAAHRVCRRTIARRLTQGVEELRRKAERLLDGDVDISNEKAFTYAAERYLKMRR